MAVNYRGDVTIEQQQGERIVCFVFDRTDTLIRYMTSSGVRASISIDEVEGIVFSGKDPAVGVTFERWIERYVERTLAGEEASLHGDESA